MRPRKAQLIGIALTAVVAAGAGASSAGAAPSPGGRERALTQAVRGAMRTAAIPGIIVGVWQEGRAPWVRAFGVRDTATRRPMRSDLYMRIGSETKTFTVTALLQLVSQGRVGLDDPIGRYVPGVVNGDTVTLRELASMTSGVPSYTQTKSFFDDLTADPRRSFSPGQLLGYVAGSPALFPPGKGFGYSNTNTVLIGLVVEKVSGEPLHRYVVRHILRPLHMRHTTFPTGGAFPRPHAHGYTEQTADGTRADATNWNPSWGWAAGAMISTVGDLRIWARHLVTGRGLGLTRVVQRERRRSVKLPPSATGSVYGLGMFDVAGWIGHNGSLPGYQTVAVYRPASRATVVALMNSDITGGRAANSTVVARAVTSVLAPGHVYELAGR